MSQELIYTSAPKGLRAGSRGFCTVASTPGMAKNLAERLEALSGYRHLFPPHDARAKDNPVAFSHLTMTVGGQRYHVLSRVSDAGLDYTNRSNKIAHHVALSAGEVGAGGPAWVLSQPHFMATRWEGEPRVLPAGRKPPEGSHEASVGRRWNEQMGDAGWAEVLAQTVNENPRKPVYIIYDPGLALLPLLVEAEALLPPKLRWNVTFSTYFTKLSPGTDCQWRCVVRGTQEAKIAAGRRHELVIDLSKRSPAPAGRAAHLNPTGLEPPTGHRLTDNHSTFSASSSPPSVNSSSVDVDEGGYDLAPMPPPAITSSVRTAQPPPLTSEKKSRRWPAIVVAVSLLLLLVGAAAGWFAWSRGHISFEDPLATISDTETKPATHVRTNVPHTSTEPSREADRPFDDVANTETIATKPTVRQSPADTNGQRRRGYSEGETGTAEEEHIAARDQGDTAVSASDDNANTDPTESSRSPPRNVDEDGANSAKNARQTGSPFEQMPTYVELPPIERTSLSERKWLKEPLHIGDISTVKSPTLGLTGGLAVKVHDPAEQGRVWDVIDDKGTIAQFSVTDGNCLFFQWTREATQNQETILANSVLTLSIDDHFRAVALRKPIPGPKSLQFRRNKPTTVDVDVPTFDEEQLELRITGIEMSGRDVPAEDVHTVSPLKSRIVLDSKYDLLGYVELQLADGPRQIVLTVAVGNEGVKYAEWYSQQQREQQRMFRESGKLFGSLNKKERQKSVDLLDASNKIQANLEYVDSALSEDIVASVEIVRIIESDVAPGKKAFVPVYVAGENKRK